MKKNMQYIKEHYLLIAVVLLLGCGIGWILKPSAVNKENAAHDHGINVQDAAATTWTCSMHPQIKQDKPGDCPICGMELIPMQSIQAHSDADPNEISMSEAALRLAEIQTTKVSKGEAERKAFMQGKIEADERNIAKLTARFGGRLEELLVNFTGQQVKKGQALASIYSPELISAQQELMEAAGFKDSNPGLYRAARARLKAWDLSEAQINQIEKASAPVTSFKILSPISGTVISRHVAKGDYIKEGMELFEIVDLSKVWLMLDAYESDLPWLHVGDAVSFTLEAQPGTTYETKIGFIDPLINPQSRVAKVRAEIDNANGLLKPEMFVSARVSSTLQQDEQSIVIPKSAVLWTGKRAVVYVKVPDRETPTFIFREIILGPDAGQSYLVTEGLRAGEEIATNGVFKIDAAAQLEGKNSMMNASKGDMDHMNMRSAHFQVSGNCDMCKNNIEKAALSVTGVQEAHWDTETKTLDLKYHSGQDNIQSVHTAVAASGYDTEKVRARDEDYSKLHDCCQYDRGDFGTSPDLHLNQSFKVSGNCDMCKERIEKAAMSIEGVNAAHWDSESQILEISTLKDLDINKVHKAIAEAGHDTDREKTSQQSYNQLPECCRYERKPMKEH